MRLSRPTLAAILALGLWFALDFVGIPRLVDAEPLLSLAGLMLVLLAAFLAAGLLEVRYVAPVYSVALAVWLWLQIDTHWGTYLLPASERKLDWYGRAFGGNLRFLPAFERRTVPDAYHSLLAILIVVNLFLALRDVMRRRSKGRLPPTR